MKHTFVQHGNTHELTLIPAPDGYRAAYQGSEHTLTDVEITPEWVRFRLNGILHTLPVSGDREKKWIAFDGQTYLLAKQTRKPRSSRSGDDNPEGILHAPMPGQVRAVHVQEGDAVAKGQTLLLLEAMKMEIRIQSPMDGKVSKIAVTVGEQVEKDQTLAVIE